MCVCTHAAVVRLHISERTKVQGFGEIVHKAMLLSSELRRAVQDEHPVKASW